MNEEHLEEVAMHSNVHQVPHDFLDQEFRRKCEGVVSCNEV